MSLADELKWPTHNYAGYALNKGKLVHLEVYKKHHKYIPKGYDIHHINHNKRDNRIENLIALPHKYHFWLHDKIYQLSNQLHNADPSVRLSKEEERSAKILHDELFTYKGIKKQLKVWRRKSNG